MDKYDRMLSPPCWKTAARPTPQLARQVNLSAPAVAERWPSSRPAG
jgi:hypothetical protein